MDEIRTAAGLIERRINPASAEFRPELRMTGDIARITGYGAVFDKLSRKLGGFVERVNQRAFSSSQGQGWPGVVCRYNHSDDWLLGTIQGNTLMLTVDGNGLHYDVEPPQTRAGQDVLTLCRRGDVVSSSFAFRVPDGGDDWGLTPYGYPLRTLLEAELVDVAPVNTPAYPDATAAARSVEGAVESLARFVDAEVTEVRSLLDNGQAMKFFKRTDRPSAQPARANEEVGERSTDDMSGMTAAELDAEARKKLSYKARKQLPKSAFAYVDDQGEGHFPIHDANHIRNALARIAQGAKYGKEALPKVKAAAKAAGINADEREFIADLVAEYRDLPEWLIDDLVAEYEDRAANTGSNQASAADENDDDEKDENDELNSAEDDSEARKGLPPALQAAIDKKNGKKPAAPDNDADDEEDDDEDDSKKPSAKPAADAPSKRSEEDEARRLRLMRLRFPDMDDEDLGTDE